jgi:solute carrier family 25 protein 16
MAYAAWESTTSHYLDKQHSRWPSSLSKAFSSIYSEDSPTRLQQSRSNKLQIPILNFYRGFNATMVGIVPYAGTFFLARGYLRSKLHSLKRDPKDYAQRPVSGTSRNIYVVNLCIGALSGAFAQTVSYPFEVIRRKMQIGGLTHPGRWIRWGETTRSIWREAAAHVPHERSCMRIIGGMKGFYVGLGIGYLKIIPMSAVTYMIWEAGKSGTGM